MTPTSRAAIDPVATEASTMEAAIRAQTPARVFVGRAGPAYRTATQLELRGDHAAARDAVWAEFDMGRDWQVDFVQRWSFFTVPTAAASKADYLLHPDRGRSLPESSRQSIASRCPRGCDVQVVIGDGLSAVAVTRQVPPLLPAIHDRVMRCGWTWGQPFVVERCRVGALNDIGDVLDARVVVLLIGERPGLATAESLSAYMAYRPRAGHTDADRNLISNIHARGVPIEKAADRIVALAAVFFREHASGVSIKEEWTPGIGSCLPGR